MSLNDEIERARRRKNDAESSTRADELRYQREQQQGYNEYQQRQKELFAKLKASLESHTSQSQLLQLFREAERLVRGNLSIVRSSTAEDITVSDNTVLIDRYKLTWGKERLVYDASGELRRPSLFDLLPTFDYHEPHNYWNSVQAQIDSNGLIKLENHEISIDIWGDDPSIIKSELADAMINPTREDDIPYRPSGMRN